MNEGHQASAYQALRCSRSTREDRQLKLIGEEPLLIRIDQQPYSVVMRTPGEEVMHAAGFCFGEGIADTRDDFTCIGYCNDLDPNVVDIRLTPERRAEISSLLERPGFVSQTSCGICGKQMVEDLQRRLIPAEDNFAASIESILGCIEQLSANQQHYRTTRGSHAAILFDHQFEMMAFAEDVGRHNALDKAIGKAFLKRELPQARLVVLSSRISYELIQKAARARLPMMISNSRPTALAVDMGKALNMTLAFPAGTAELIVVCGGQRIGAV